MRNDRRADHRPYLRGPYHKQDEEDSETSSSLLQAKVPEVVEDADANGKTRPGEETCETPRDGQSGVVLRAAAEDSKEKGERDCDVVDYSTAVQFTGCGSEEGADSNAVGIEGGRSDG